MPAVGIIPLSLEYLAWWQAAALFAALALPTVLLGVRSMAAVEPVRRWTAIGLRLVVLALLVLLLAGAHWQRTSDELEVIVLRDVSASTRLADLNAGVVAATEQFLDAAIDRPESRKRPDDRIGVISFDERPYIDALPNRQLQRGALAVHGSGQGTNVAEAVQLALASFSEGAKRRLLLVWDGNLTGGDLDAAIATAVEQGVPIDVMPLSYRVNNEVLVDRLVTPTRRRENEPFEIDVILRNTNPFAVTGELSVLLQGSPMDLEPLEGGEQTTRQVTLQPGPNRQTVRVPAIDSAGVLQFEAIFDTAGAAAADTLAANNRASGFTFMQGKSRTLFIDGSAAGPDALAGEGALLEAALRREGIEIGRRLGVAAFPTGMLQLQGYDAVILYNVPRGDGGLGDDQDRILADYVHETGGGLVMIGGENAFGAGGWQGSRTEEVLPVLMQIPSKRVIHKGALQLIMHSTEMPQGNYWGEQAAIKAVETLARRDEVGVISWAWQGNNGAGSQYDFPLQERGDGSRAIAAIKNMQLGDMPTFVDAMNVALNGINGQPGLLQSNARQKHVIIISDGDPSPPQPETLQAFVDNKISISTITVTPHPGSDYSIMTRLAELTGGTAYPVVNDNFNQIPQIFIKEATVVRRTLIIEEPAGIPVNGTLAGGELIRGIETLPPVLGMVLTGRRDDPTVQMPLTAGAEGDPLLAYWQSGLGRAAVFTSDAHNEWATNIVNSADYDKFWAQVVRGVGRPAESTDFDVTVNVEGGVGRIVVEAFDKEDAFRNALSIAGTVSVPQGESVPVALRQTGAGRYEGTFEADEPGSYVASLQFSGEGGETGQLLGGTAVNASPELARLSSNEAALREVARRTGGRFIERPFDPQAVELFERQDLPPRVARLPIWQLLLPWLVGLMIADVAVRRLAWDQRTPARLAGRLRNAVLAYTSVARQREGGGQTVDALRGVRDKPRTEQAAQQAPPTQARPQPTFKFEARADAPAGDLTQAVGGATEKPLPKQKQQKQQPKGLSGEKAGEGGMSSLMEAKKRAREEMEKRKSE